MIYFVRHGETVWNVENKICGITDSPLTEKGHRQAAETGRKIREKEGRKEKVEEGPKDLRGKCDR